jgi:hypothetical protein
MYCKRNIVNIVNHVIHRESNLFQWNVSYSNVVSTSVWATFMTVCSMNDDLTKLEVQICAVCF